MTHDFQALHWACLHLYNADKALAATHTHPVFFKPLTVRLFSLMISLGFMETQDQETIEVMEFATIHNMLKPEENHAPRS